MSKPAADSHKPRLTANKWLAARWLVAVVVIAVCFLWAMPSFAPYSDVIDTLRVALPAASTATLLTIVIVIVGNLFTPSLSQMAALPGLRLRSAATLDWATTMVTNVVPGGSAGSIAITWSTYRRLGFTNDQVGRSVIVTGVLDQLVKLGVPLPAVGWLLARQQGLSTDGSVPQTLLVRSALVAAVLFVVAAGLSAVVVTNGRLGDRFAAGASRLAQLVVDPIASRLRRQPVDWPKQMRRLRYDTRRLLADRGPLLVATVIVGHANLFLLLMLCLRVAGVSSSMVGWAAGLTAFSFARLTTAVPLTPGALGVAEVSLIGALELVSEADLPAVVSAVVLYRAASFVLPTILGLPSAVVISRPTGPSHQAVC